MKPKKTGNDFRESAEKNGINYWPIRNCSICDYELGYLFWFDDAEVVFDSGCDCTRRYKKTIRTWDDVANHYNINIENEDVIKSYDEYWKF